MNHSAIGNVVNNHYLRGSDSGEPAFLLENGGPVRVGGKTQAERGGTRLYTSGNWGPKRPFAGGDDWVEFYTTDYYRIDRSVRPAEAATFRSVTEFPTAPVKTDPVSEVKGKVLAYAGATKPFRDSLDTRIVNDVLKGGGSTSGIGYGGPWPELSGGPPPVDTDNDGMPDAWERRHGLNPKAAADGSKVAENGYTNVENYLNELAGDPVF